MSPEWDALRNEAHERYMALARQHEGELIVADLRGANLQDTNLRGSRR